MNYKYPLYAPWWKVEQGKKPWYNTLSSLFKMINVKDNGDGSFIIEWDENDPEESILNDWTKEDFIDFFNYRLGLEKSQQEYIGKNAEKFGGKSKETSNVSEATEEDYEDFWEGEIIEDSYIQATNEETFGKDGYPTKDDRIWEG